MLHASMPSLNVPSVCLCLETIMRRVLCNVRLHSRPCCFNARSGACVTGVAVQDMEDVVCRGACVLDKGALMWPPPPPPTPPPTPSKPKQEIKEVGDMYCGINKRECLMRPQCDEDNHASQGSASTPPGCQTLA